MTYIADTVSWLRLGDAPPEALLRYVNEALCLGAHLSARESVRAVAVKPLIESSDVDLDNVSLVDDAGTGDTVNHLIVDTDAGASGESAVTEEGGLCALTLDMPSDDGIELLRGNAGRMASAASRIDSPVILPASFISFI